MPNHLTTLATVLAVSTLLAACLWPLLARRGRQASRRDGAKAKDVSPPAETRIRALEAELAEARAANAALRETRDLQARLCGMYERIIESLSPGLLPRPRETAPQAPGESAAMSAASASSSGGESAGR